MRKLKIRQLLRDSVFKQDDLINEGDKKNATLVDFQNITKITEAKFEILAFVPIGSFSLREQFVYQ